MTSAVPDRHFALVYCYDFIPTVMANYKNKCNSQACDHWSIVSAVSYNYKTAMNGLCTSLCSRHGHDSLSQKLKRIDFWKNHLIHELHWFISREDRLSLEFNGLKTFVRWADSIQIKVSGTWVCLCRVFFQALGYFIEARLNSLAGVEGAFTCRRGAASGQKTLSCIERRWTGFTGPSRLGTFRSGVAPLRTVLLFGRSRTYR